MIKENMMTWIITGVLSLALLIAMLKDHVVTACFLSLPLVAIGITVYIIESEQKEG